jgi:phosphoenolpyruvate synthase/pyruvate phosphate dikinase
MATSTDNVAKWVLPLAAPTLMLVDVGGKGANLGVMIRAGLPVPGGFVVTTDGYRAFVAANALAPLIERQWQEITLGDAAAFEAASSAIRAAFTQAAFLPNLAADILIAYAGLGDKAPVAVRSSATAEDLPDASFAGQQETYLNVIGGEALLDAVKRCWASLWTARAMAYRLRQKIAPAQVSLAVVVQEMAPANAAGVMFTVNPVTGERGELVINATWGLGEALVSGRVNPDMIVADKQSGRIKHVALGDKAVMTAAVASGTDEVAVDEARRGKQAITPEQVVELARLGRELEARFRQRAGCRVGGGGRSGPLLQSRPVTSVAAPAGPPGDDAWPELAACPPNPSTSGRSKTWASAGPTR